jgi:hypothetical protein
MLKKYGKFYADWDDEHGKRHRKAFRAKKAALQFQAKRRNEVAAKKARPTRVSRPSSKPGRKHGRAPATHNALKFVLPLAKR